ncbi:unnamed protein product [Lymnaea stagnalis]|uniref:Phosphoenolpyruvate synthase n=1 Tax=Lymnaea stagnalis TaxID=6523 RepID=A0AAV2I792_LYMST
MISLAICAGIVVLAIAYISRQRGSEIKAGVYKLPGQWYWLKRIIFCIMFRIRSAKQGKKDNFDSFSAETCPMKVNGRKGYGKGNSYKEMERPQTLSENEFAIDCCYFGATNQDGVNLVCRIARRKHRQAEVWLFLEIPGIGCLQFPRHPDTDVYHTDGNSYQAGGLTFEILEPMKRWKLTYSGKLRKGLCNDVVNKPQQYLETSFSFIWSAFSQPFNFDTDMAPSLLADSIAWENWNKDFFQRLKDNHQSHYEQWGELRGRLNVEGQEEQLLTLQCVRDHTFGRRDWRSFHRYIIQFIHLENGISIQVGIVSQPDLMTHVKIGYISFANGDIMSVTDVTLKLWEIGEETMDPPDTWAFSFTAGGARYNVTATKGTTPVWYHHDDRGGKVMEVFTTFEVNSIKGRGISEYFYRNHNGPIMTDLPSACDMVEEPTSSVVSQNRDKITLPFTSAACSSSALVGGKGSQLAQLTSLETKVNAHVPKGFCLTLKSFELQLQESSKIRAAIEAISSACVTEGADLTPVCSTAVDLFNSTEMCSQVRDAIVKSLNEYFGKDHDHIHYAVRSSAAGEDGTEASSAGQMETILGVVGLPQIFKAVSKCWSSVYTVQAVEYRRQHGQPISVLVGVVIQQMVPAKAAGVMFTADPINGSNSQVVINANYGLGESVVSGRSDPDTICVTRDPEFIYDGERLKIGNVRAGEKKIQIVETASGGITEEHLTGCSDQVCITDKIILSLSALGLELEKYFGSPRDIEWAVVGEDIYMLQCRPITVADSETEDDLIHEFDTPKSCDFQWWTTGNISEMMPGAVTPLTHNLFCNAINYSLQTLTRLMGARQRASHLPKAIMSSCNHLFLSLMDISSVFLSSLMVRTDALAISLLGELLPELNEEEIQKYYFRKSPGVLRRTVNFFNTMRTLMKAGKETARWEERIRTYEVGPRTKTSAELYHCIDQQLTDYETVWMWTLLNSAKSGNMAQVLMSVIGGECQNWTSEHYGDIALLLSNCDDVYSAEVPHAMAKIAGMIAKKGPKSVEQFLDTSDKDCVQLILDDQELDQAVNEFLSRHGHRCLREAEMREKSWRSAPEKFISVLKIILKTKSYEKSLRDPVSVSELLSKMKTKISFTKRQILRFLLPKSWQAVGSREWGKSVSIQMVELFKLAYYRLATLLYKEGRLPDPDLIYFLTHQEISKLITSRSARLIIKAQKRRKILSKQADKKFMKISKAGPQLIDVNTSRADTANVECLKGMPVSQGQVTGPARVVLSLDQASVIKSGDILVVSSTDVGWSPYFPLIGGLITELGGLISHGAVVAREYGIPCIVNVGNATSILNSGELLEIDGRLGTVKRLNVQKQV